MATLPDDNLGGFSPGPRDQADAPGPVGNPAGFEPGPRDTSTPGAQPEAPENWLAREGSLGVRALASGAASVAGAPGDVANLVDKGLAAVGYSPAVATGQALGDIPTPGRVPAALYHSVPAPPLPTSADINSPAQNALTSFGLPNPTPTHGEALAGAAVSAVPQVLATGGEGLLAQAGGNVAATEADRQLASAPTWLRTGVDFLAGLAGYGSVSKVGNLVEEAKLTKAAAAAHQSAQADLDAFDQKYDLASQRSGAMTFGQTELEKQRAAAQAIHDNLSADNDQKLAGLDSSHQEFVASADNHLAQAKLASGVALEAQNQATKQVQGEVASTLGPPRDIQATGKAIQSYARNWLDVQLPQKIAEFEAPVEAKVGGSAPVDLTPFVGTLKSITGGGGGLADAASVFRPKAPDRLLKLFDESGHEHEADPLSPETADSAPQHLSTWKDVSSLRSAVGEAMTNPKIFNDVGPDNLRRMYASLTDVLRTTAEAHDAGPEFEEYNKNSSAWYQAGERTIGKIVKGERESSGDPLPEKVTKSLLGSATTGPSTIEDLRNFGLGPAADALGAYALHHADEHQASWGPPAWESLEPKAKAALVGGSEKAALVEGSRAQRAEVEAGIPAKLGTLESNLAEAKTAAADLNSRAKAGIQAQTEASKAGYTSTVNSLNRAVQGERTHLTRRVADTAEALAARKSPQSSESGVAVKDAIAGLVGHALEPGLGVAGYAGGVLARHAIHPLVHGAIGSIQHLVSSPRILAGAGLATTVASNRLTPRSTK